MRFDEASVITDQIFAAEVNDKNIFFQRNINFLSDTFIKKLRTEKDKNADFLLSAKELRKISFCDPYSLHSISFNQEMQKIFKAIRQANPKLLNEIDTVDAYLVDKSHDGINMAVNPQKRKAAFFIGKSRVSLCADKPDLYAFSLLYNLHMEANRKEGKFFSSSEEEKNAIFHDVTDTLYKMGADVYAGVHYYQLLRRIASTNEDKEKFQKTIDSLRNHIHAKGYGIMGNQRNLLNIPSFETIENVPGYVYWFLAPKKASKKHKLGKKDVLSYMKEKQKEVSLKANQSLATRRQIGKLVSKARSSPVIAGILKDLEENGWKIFAFDKASGFFSDNIGASVNGTSKSIHMRLENLNEPSGLYNFFHEVFHAKRFLDWEKSGRHDLLFKPQSYSTVFELEMNDDALAFQEISKLKDIYPETYLFAATRGLNFRYKVHEGFYGQNGERVNDPLSFGKKRFIAENWYSSYNMTRNEVASLSPYSMSDMAELGGKSISVYDLKLQIKDSLPPFVPYADKKEKTRRMRGIKRKGMPDSSEKEAAVHLIPFLPIKPVKSR